MSDASSSSSPLLVACLCAQWCGSCRDYRPVFERMAGEFGAQARFAWVDIEDHDEVVGALEIDNFPTLLIADTADRVLFFGALEPHPQTLARLIRRAAARELAAVAAVAGLDGLPARVRTLLQHSPFA